MTKEEKQKAIDALKISLPFMAVTHEEFNDYIQIRNQVMDWLEQQPCDDTVSRQAVDTLVDELARAISDERCYMSRGRSTGRIMQDILDLPSVVPKEKSECEHDHEAVKAYNDGQAYILDKIRVEIEEMKLDVDLDIGNEMIYNNAIKDVLQILDKYGGDTGA